MFAKEESPICAASSVSSDLSSGTDSRNEHAVGDKFDKSRGEDCSQREEQYGTKHGGAVRIIVVVCIDFTSQPSSTPEEDVTCKNGLKHHQLPYIPTA